MRADWKDERSESEFLMQGDWKGVPDGWAIGGKRAGAKGRVWSTGCVGGEGRRQSEESEREYRGGEIWRGSKAKSC